MCPAVQSGGSSFELAGLDETFQLSTATVSETLTVLLRCCESSRTQSPNLAAPHSSLELRSAALKIRSHMYLFRTQMSWLSGVSAKGRVEKGQIPSPSELTTIASSHSRNSRNKP